MTREEAAKNPVDLAIWEFENAIKGTEEDNSEYPNYCIHIDEYKTALKALLWMKGPQPDPETGLVPCGCGGEAGFHYSVMILDNDCCVACGVCGEHSKVALSEEEARDAWNAAMGWGGGQEHDADR